jgi:arabinan endo-1,5-alpha-L-arabinosidase
MSYGSYWSGINIIELDPSTGKPLPGTGKGKRIASRSRSGASLEGPEILYNEELGKYYLFVSYGWLEDSYNVRVGRSDKPDGPFLDYYGNDMAAAGDNLPRITAPYKFDNHPGWQGFGHCGLFRDGDNYYYVSQARLANNIYMMNLHLRRILWTPDGWPVIAPERYTLVPQTLTTTIDLLGQWELIMLDETETSNHSVHIELHENGTLSGMENSSWEYTDGVLSISLKADEIEITAMVSDEWDWENEQQTLCFSGLSDAGIGAWGKKINTEQ